MINKADIEKLQRFRKGISNEQDEKYIHSFFAENEDNGELKRHVYHEFNEYLKNYSGSNFNLTYLLDRIHHSIHKKEYQKNQTVVKRIYRWYSVAAAVLLIPILIAGTIWFTNKNRETAVITEALSTTTLYAPLGARISFDLPDGTHGWLNSGSSLEYKLPFSTNRQVALSGEGWFDVAHDEEHPFEIAAGGSKVEVLGTKFNLSTYPEEKYLEIVLEEGKVELTIPGVLSKLEMKPNERLMLAEGNVNIEEVDAFKFSGWKEGKLIFRGDSMDKVAKRIARWYNVNIEVVDDELKNYTFRGTFQDDSLEDMIRDLSMTSPIRYQIIDRKILDNGTIQKKKVLLYKKNI